MSSSFEKTLSRAVESIRMVQHPNSSQLNVSIDGAMT